METVGHGRHFGIRALGVQPANYRGPGTARSLFNFFGGFFVRARQIRGRFNLRVPKNTISILKTKGIDRVQPGIALHVSGQPLFLDARVKVHALRQ